MDKERIGIRILKWLEENTYKDSITGQIRAVSPAISRQEIAGFIERESGVYDLIPALENMVASTEAWNNAMEEIIGKQPNTGIDLQKAKEVLAKY